MYKVACIIFVSHISKNLYENKDSVYQGNWPGCFQKSLHWGGCDSILNKMKET